MGTQIEMLAGGWRAKEGCLVFLLASSDMFNTTVELPYLILNNPFGELIIDIVSSNSGNSLQLASNSGNKRTVSGK